MAQGVEQACPHDGGFAAAGGAGDGDEGGCLYLPEQLFNEGFTAEEEFGVAFLEGAETEVGDAAVPDGGLVLVFELNDEFGDLLDGEAVVVVGGGDFVAADEVATDFDVDVTAGREVGGLGCWLVLLVGHWVLVVVRSPAVGLDKLLLKGAII